MRATVCGAVQYHACASAPVGHVTSAAHLPPKSARGAFASEVVGRLQEDLSAAIEVDLLVGPSRWPERCGSGTGEGLLVRQVPANEGDSPVVPK